MRLDQMASSMNEKLNRSTEQEALDSLSKEILENIPLMECSINGNKDIKVGEFIGIKEALINMFKLGKLRSDLEKKEEERKGITKGIVPHQLNERDSRALLLSSVTRWGVDSQIDQALEEMAELSIVLLKRNREVNGSNTKDIIDEIADVFICIHQLRMVYGTIEVDKVVKKKLKRLRNLFNSNKPKYKPNEIDVGKN